MNKIKSLCSVALLSSIAHSPACATGWTVGARIGTLGVQGEVGYLFNSTFGLRLLGGGYEHFQPHLEYNGVHYHHIRYRAITAHVIADWYFLKEWWRASAGVGYTGTRIRLKQDKRKEKSNEKYLGVITAKYKYKRKIAYYLGTGFDFTNVFGSNFTVSIDAGINFQGKVKSKIAATGLAKTNANAMAKAHKTATKLMNEAWWVRNYPVISIGVKYPL